MGGIHGGESLQFVTVEGARKGILGLGGHVLEPGPVEPLEEAMGLDLRHGEPRGLGGRSSRHGRDPHLSRPICAESVLRLRGEQPLDTLDRFLRNLTHPGFRGGGLGRAMGYTPPDNPGSSPLRRPKAPPWQQHGSRRMTPLPKRRTAPRHTTMTCPTAATCVTSPRRTFAKTSSK